MNKIQILTHFSLYTYIHSKYHVNTVQNFKEKRHIEYKMLFILNTMRTIVYLSAEHLKRRIYLAMQIAEPCKG